MACGPARPSPGPSHLNELADDFVLPMHSFVSSVRLAARASQRDFNVGQCFKYDGLSVQPEHGLTCDKTAAALPARWIGTD